mgnify:CR=1 FL=1
MDRTSCDLDLYELPRREHVSTEEAAEIAGLTAKGVRHALEKRRLAGFKVGGRWRVWLSGIPIWRANTIRNRAEARLRNLAIAWNANKEAATCPRCGLITDDGDLCADCRHEQKTGHYRWHDDMAGAMSTANWAR